jgi:formylglycine-generating enzyme required for sulfatase activity
LCGGLAGCFAQAQDKTFSNSIGLEFVEIPAGEFNIIGQHERMVTISKPFYLGKFVK